jgi:hypothetical protein
MSPRYAWVCHLCSVTNAAGLSSCAKCGFAAEASTKEIEAAQSALGVRQPVGWSAPRESEPKEPVSLSAKIVEVLLIVALVVGGILAKFAPPIWLNFVGVVLAGIGFAGLWVVGWIRKGRRAHV